MICRWSLKGEAESFSSEICYFVFSLNIYSSPFSTQSFEYGFLISASEDIYEAIYMYFIAQNICGQVLPTWTDIL